MTVFAKSKSRTGGSFHNGECIFSVGNEIVKECKLLMLDSNKILYILLSMVNLYTKHEALVKSYLTQVNSSH